MASFNDSIQPLLWPEKRQKDPILGDKVPGYIYRTTTTSYLKVAPGYLPAGLEKLLSWSDRLPQFFPWLCSERIVKIGPIPKGTPVNLLSNLDLEANKLKLAELLLRMIADLKKVEGAGDAEAAKVFKNLVPERLALSKCLDFVVNKGHYFGTDLFKEEPGLSDDDKWALIEYLKTF